MARTPSRFQHNMDDWTKINLPAIRSSIICSDYVGLIRYVGKHNPEALVNMIIEDKVGVQFFGNRLATRCPSTATDFANSVLTLAYERSQITRRPEKTRPEKTRPDIAPSPKRIKLTPSIGKESPDTPPVGVPTNRVFGALPDDRVIDGALPVGVPDDRVIVGALPVGVPTNRASVDMQNNIAANVLSELDSDKNNSPELESGGETGLGGETESDSEAESDGGTKPSEKSTTTIQPWMIQKLENAKMGNPDVMPSHAVRKELEHQLGLNYMQIYKYYYTQGLRMYT